LFESRFKQKRIFSYDWNLYSADKVLYHPKNMSGQKLQELLQYAWDSFYAKESQQMKMARLFGRVIQKEKADNTYKHRDRKFISQAFGKQIHQGG